MADDTYGLRFSEVMAGYMAPAADFASGYRLGRASATAVRFQATISIADLDRFLQELEHEAPMTALVDYAGLGSNLPAHDGRFNLFCRRDGHKRILYRLPFDCGNQRYILFGQKFIGDRPGLNVWRDMTTLHTELWVPGPAGEPVGAPLARGILTISLPAVIRQLSTFQPLGHPSLLTLLSMHARFLASFTREIADTYGRRLVP